MGAVAVFVLMLFSIFAWISGRAVSARAIAPCGGASDAVVGSATGVALGGVVAATDTAAADTAAVVTAPGAVAGVLSVVVAGLTCITVAVAVAVAAVAAPVTGVAAGLVLAFKLLGCASWSAALLV